MQDHGFFSTCNVYIGLKQKHYFIFFILQYFLNAKTWKIMQAGVEIRSEIYYITWKENRDTIIVVVIIDQWEDGAKLSICVKIEPSHSSMLEKRKIWQDWFLYTAPKPNKVQFDEFQKAKSISTKIIIHTQSRKQIMPTSITLNWKSSKFVLTHLYSLRHNHFRK